MKVNIITADSDIVSTHLFGEYSGRIMERSRDKMARLSRNLTDGARSMFDRATRRMEELFDPELTRLARRIRRANKHQYQEDNYFFIDSQEGMANAPNRMREMITSEPRVRRMIQQQRLDGYGIKPNSSRISSPITEDPFWKAATNGLSKEVQCERTGKTIWVSDYEYGANYVDDHHVYIEDQVDILATWDRVNQLLDEGIDPTSPLGEKIMS